MSLGRVPVALALALTLAGCAGPAPSATVPSATVPSGPTAPAGPSASVTPTGSVVPPSASPTTVPTSASSAPGTSAPATSPGPAGPSVPAGTALDVSAWPKADFASPSGRLWCGLTADSALCHFPRGFWGRIPTGAEICPKEGLDVTGVAVTASGTAYFCSGDPSAFPVRGQDSVAWHGSTGYPFVAYDGFTLAVLPYGRTLRHGDYVCASAENGVTCADRATGHGFRIALAGVDFF